MIHSLRHFLRYLFTWLHGVPVVVCRLSCTRTLQLWCSGSGHMGSAVLTHGFVPLRHVGSQFPEQGSKPHPRHCKADSEPLDQQGSPPTRMFSLVHSFTHAASSYGAPAPCRTPCWAPAAPRWAVPSPAPVIPELAFLLGRPQSNNKS